MPWKPIIGITMGDPAGIGPEIIVKAFSKEKYESHLNKCRPVVIGDAKTLKYTAEFLNRRLKIQPVDSTEQIEGWSFKSGTASVLDLNNVALESLQMGKVQKMCGRAAIEYIEAAANAAKEEKIHAISTAPINKQAIKKAGHPHPGHTETLAALTGVPPQEVTMMLIAENLRVFHVTLHQSLKNAVSAVDKRKVYETIKIAEKGLLDLGIENPKVAVAGLNPHASDGGTFGNEEVEEIKPAIEKANNEGVNALGPIPPDTVFLKAKEGKFDGVVAQYHDQGHIPIKLLGFNKGVNVTIGLPIVRTSVDHGTAFDIAGKGKADPTNIVEAIKTATVMAKAKFSHEGN